MMGHWKLTPAVVLLKTSAVWFHRSSFDTIENPLASSRYGIVAPSGAGMSINCWKSSPIQPTAGYRG